MRPLVVFTIGHSTRAIEDYIRLLKAHEVRWLIDVRKIESERRSGTQHERDVGLSALHECESPHRPLGRRRPVRLLSQVLLQCDRVVVLCVV